MQEMIKRAKELLADGTVVRVLGWKRCDLPYNPEPAFFGTEKELDALVYDGFCGGQNPGVLKALRHLQLQPAGEGAPD